MLRLIFALLLLSVSLLSVFKAPTNLLWQASVAITNFPYIPMLLALVAFYLGYKFNGYRAAVMIISAVAFVIFSLPIFAAFVQAKKIPSEMKEVFAVNNEETLPPVFSFFKMFGRNTSVQYQTFGYKKIEERNLEVDYYSAALKTKAPLVITIHGGSWQGGDNKQLPELNSYLTTYGYNVAAITYRLAPNYKAPSPVEDVADAIKYLIANAEKLNIDTNSIILVGRSAGAQIALCAAYTLHLKNIKGVVSYYGPADMVWGGQVKVNKKVLNTDLIYDNYFGGGYEELPQKFVESSAVHRADSAAPPTLLIHGKIDPLVSFNHGPRLVKRLNELNVPNYFLQLPYATHGCDYSLKSPAGQVCTYAVVRFIKAVLK